MKLFKYLKINFSFLFYFLWITLSILQACFTELLNDEAYYWKYSSKLDWGYFDHPPMIALIIKLGYLIFKNEFGIRLFPILLNILTIYFFERLIKPKDKILFYVIISSIAIIQIAGIFAIPDTPLLFFSVGFYYSFNRYVEKDNPRNAILLTICICLLLYSKYQGILVILFSLLSNIKLLRRKSLWLCITFSLLLVMPHLFWQLNNNFPSIKYHLFERGSNEFTLSNTFIYLFTQPFVYGPFIGLWLIYSLFAFRPNNRFERTLKINALATFVFFLAMTLKGRVEGNWTFIALLPLVFIGVKQAEINPKIQRIIYLLFPITLLLIFFVRLNMIWPILPAKWNIKTELYNNETWAEQIHQIAQKKPVAFMNSYQSASKYEFYTGNQSFTVNNIEGRKNQYTIWDSEFEYQGKNIVLFLNYYDLHLPTVQTIKGSYQYVLIDNFRSYGNIKVEVDKNILAVKKNEKIHLNVKLIYLNSNQRDTESNIDYPANVSYVVFQDKKRIMENKTELQITNSMLNSGKEYDIKIAFPINQGQYELYLCTKAGWLPSAINGDLIKLIILE